MRIIWKTLAICAALIVLLIFAGSVWNLIEEKRLVKHNPPPGRFYEVNGRAMHLTCKGTGRPTIVAEAGSGEDSLTWTLLQNSLSTKYRFCSYDRAGTGWSEPQPGTRDARAIVNQLHALLTVAHEPGPFVLLGHSLGGLYIKEYSRKYPSDVAALIFLDGVTPAAYQGKASEALGLDPKRIRQLTHFSLLGWATEISGYARLTHHCSGFPPLLSSIQGLFKADQCIPSHNTEERREGAAIADDLKEVSESAITIPILVLSEDKSPVLQTPKAIATWNTLQAHMLTLSPKSYRVIASNSNHFLQLNCPHFSSDQISDFLQAIASKRIIYGTTNTTPCH